jgi:hypothetical protein
MTNLIRVIETYMWDGNDLIHEWYSVKEALESGRFDYLIEDGSYKEKQLTSCKSVEELVNLAGYPFSVWKEPIIEDTYISLDEIYASSMLLRYQNVFKKTKIN